MDIDDITRYLHTELLTRGVLQKCLKELDETPDVYEKVDFVEELLRHACRGIPGIHSKIVAQNKNNDDSEKFRKEGNEYFALKNKNYLKAVEFYNKSICFAPKGSENLGIGYANRSAIFLAWKNYKECLESIELARCSNYPDKLLPKLQKREEQCLQDMNKSEENDDNLYKVEFDLSHEKHAQIPFISKCLDIKKDEKRGRYVYTKEELVPGQLVSIDEPFCSILMPQHRYLRCANCNIENNFNLIPCPNCTSAMFCSEKCIEEANWFHKYECPVIDALFQLYGSNDVPLLALRVTLLGMHCFDDVEKLMKFCKAPENQNKDAFSIDYENFNKTEHYRTIYGLETHQDELTTKLLLHRAVICAMLRYFMLEADSPLKEVFKTEETYNFFTNLLFKHLQAIIVNSHELSFIDILTSKNNINYSSAVYGFNSLFLHSCAPNVVRILKDTKCYTFILRPIPKNGILYENYNFHYLDQSRQCRQENLKHQHNFLCECEACVNDYPQNNELGFAPVFSELDLSFLNDKNMLLSMNKKFAKENYERYSSFLHRYAEHYPCRQIVLAEAQWQMAVYILLDAIPLEWKVPFM